MDGHMLRKCAKCQLKLGCYFPEKRTCTSCEGGNCPHTSLVTHTLCPACFEEAAGKVDRKGFAGKRQMIPA